MKKIKLVGYFIIVGLIKNVICLNVINNRKFEIISDLPTYYKDGNKHMRKKMYMHINMHNFENNMSNDMLRNKYMDENDSNKYDLSKLKKLKDLINKYNLNININKEDIEKVKAKTKELLLYKYNDAKKYYKIVSNKLKDDSVIYYNQFKAYYNVSFNYLKDKYNNSYIQEYVNKIPFFNKPTHLSKMISYNSVNILFLLFTLFCFKANYLYAFFKKRYAFIGEFQNTKTEKLVKIHTLSTLFFFFYKFCILRLIFIINSYDFFSKKFYLVNNLVHVLFFSYISLFPYLLVQANWGSFHLLGSKKSKMLGWAALTQLFFIYTRLIFQSNLSFLKKWTDEQFFNKDEILKEIKESEKMDFYVNLLNQYSFLKKLYLGNNKIYEVALYLHRYKYLLDIVSPINSLFYIYIVHSIYFYLNNLSFAGIYVSSFSFALLMLKILSNKIDLYFLRKF
ncbi:conserved Plasmodium protein, unknown function [Plasmodium vinckei]|uniref:Uncharacterized protein n=3 Tax=Plasmodium vinckei TaxID=5860 RepID=W7AM79_PLAVN|nr:hypothetical protein YYG_04936 [Plasmodium vinckei petteri]CAD2086847.1 conserved Plasmodium protein, unknown function [Plasmodium vinckei brucechwatti]CAD2112052.1 conserved Plasmodium protein, unknown function [Plasmodium vinckei]CAD2112199.1 conserved Plasmodium protein, unknown function [Plasmodium vinckei petteri]